MKKEGTNLTLALNNEFVFVLTGLVPADLQ